MNDLFMALGIEAWKPLLSTLVLSPAPFLALVLLGAWLLPRRRLLGWAGVLLGSAGIWLMCTTAVGGSLLLGLEREYPMLSNTDIAALKNTPGTAVLVLGAGRVALAPEYGDADLKPMTWQRLRYGLWLARRTGLPAGYSGGLAYRVAPGPTEAEVAARVASKELGLPLRWIEDKARDTNENALRSLELLAPQGIQRIVLVTHGFHMPRAMVAFERAKRRSGTTMILLPAPMGLHRDGDIEPGDWLPSTAGFDMTVLALHEWLGRKMGA